MKYKEYEKAFSAARLNKYLHACDGNTDKALQLYRLNIKLCQKLYGVLNVFEIVLRNAIHEHYKIFLSDSDWIKTQLSDGGMLSRVDTTFARTHYMLILRVFIISWIQGGTNSVRIRCPAKCYFSED